MATIEELINHAERWRETDPPATYTAALLSESARDIKLLRDMLIELIEWMDNSGTSHTKSIGIGPFKTEPFEYSVVTMAREIVDATDKKQ